MSYILEALRKSNAERERGAVPDLHAQPIALAGADEDAAPGRAKPWLWLVGGAVIALSAAVAWRFTAHDAPPLLAAAPAPLPAPAPAPAPSPPPAPSPQPEAAPAPAPVPAPVTAPVPTPVQKATQKAPPEPAAKPAPRTRAKPQAPTPAAVTAAKKPEAPQPAARVPLLSELPDDLRRQVPAMAIGGSVYSPQPASRMLIVNGQVFREGSPLAPELQLEQIGAKAAVFSIRGQRFEVPL